MQNLNLQHKEALNAIGVYFDDHKYNVLTNEIKKSIAMDAQPTLGTSPNSSIPSFLTTFYDPKVIDVLFSPMMGAEVAGQETIKGDWTNNVIYFNVLEFTGVVAAYDDFSNNGISKANTNFPSRQPFIYQTNIRWGELEAARMALTRVDWIAQQQRSTMNTLNRYQNLTYFFGVEGLVNYGLLNDPNLPPAIPPSGGIAWSNPAKDGQGIYNDLLSLAADLITRSSGIVNQMSKMTLAISPYALPYLDKTTTFMAVTARELFVKQYPNTTIVVAPELDTVTGQTVRLKADANDGTLTEEVAYNLKLRTFPVFPNLSNYMQKYAQGTIGNLLYRPVLVSRMVGV